MGLDPANELELAQIARNVAAAMNAKVVPLIRATKNDQKVFVQWFAKHVNGKVLQSGSAYPSTMFLETLERMEYLFVLIQDDLSEDLYMIIRDYILNRDVPLNTKFGEYTIHPDHRLILLINDATLLALPADQRQTLLKLCRVNYVSEDPEEILVENDQETRHGYPVFENLEKVIKWCERYYGNNQFYFRGQSQDWALRAPIFRFLTIEDRDRAMNRTERFFEWLSEKDEFSEINADPDKSMAVAQHFGFPTAFLDLTKNPRVAGYFATFDVTHPEDKLGVIYVYSKFELETNLSFADEAAEKFGKGLTATEVSSLRRMKHQQGLFVHSIPELIDGFLLTKLYFHHTDDFSQQDERNLVPKEFIFPPPSPLERKIYAYILIESASGILDTSPKWASSDFKSSAVSYDMGGYMQRQFLNSSPFAASQSIPSLFTALDVNSSLIGLTSSFLFVHNTNYTSHIYRFGRELIDGRIDQAKFGEWKHAFDSLLYPINVRSPVAAGDLKEFSVRDLVGGLALYHHFRDGNPQSDIDTIGMNMSAATEHLWRAFRFAEYYFGRDAENRYLYASAFALNCSDPVGAFTAAIKQMGLHGNIDMTDMPYPQAERTLALWTGYEPIAVEDAEQELVALPWLKNARERLNQLREKGVESVLNLGFSLSKIGSMEILDEIVPQFRKSANNQLVVYKYDAELAPTVAFLEPIRSIVDGLFDGGATMLCQQVDCPLHKYRICARVTKIPQQYQDCQYPGLLKERYSLTPELLQAVIN